MRLAAGIGLLALAGLALFLSIDMTGVARWAAEQQRGFQNQMAVAIRALRAGEAQALAGLFAAAGAYGLVHAIGPGHGKYLIGGVGLGTAVPVARLVSVALVSSLAQALWAIVLVYGALALLEVSAGALTALAEDILAPASYLAIAGVGAILVWRGLAALSRRAVAAPAGADGHAHGDACGCHGHGPSPEAVARLGSLREAAVLIGSIAIRPCTGAVFLLVIAWQMDIRIAGATAVIVMGLGTAVVTGAVAVSSVAARGAAWVSADRLGAASVAIPVLQTLAGATILWMSLVLLGLAAP